MDSALCATAAAQQGDQFQAMLGTGQAPPGPEPPPPDPQTGSRKKEQAIHEPNAQSTKPDLSPEKKAESPQAGEKPSNPPNGPQLALLITPNLTLSAKVTETSAPAKPVAPAPAALSAPTPGKDAVSLRDLPKSDSANIVSAKAVVPPQGVAAAQKSKADEAADVKIAADARTFEAALRVQDEDDAKYGQIASEPASKGEALPEAPSGGGALSQSVPQIAGGAADSGGQPSMGQGGHGPAYDSSPAPAGNVKAAVQPPANPQEVVPSAPAQSLSPAAPQTIHQAAAAALGSEKLIGEIASHVEKLATAKAGADVTVHLQTDDLTNVLLTVKTLRGQVEAQITTDNPALRNALHQNRPQLAQSFDAKGMNLGQVSVGLKGGGGERQAPRDHQRSNSQLQHREPSQAQGQPRQLRPKSDGVDLWI